MKNTLYFNSDFGVELLENIEDNLNSIYLNVTTSSALNQRIEVRLRGVSQFFNLDSGVVNNFELSGTLWAVDGNTEFRFSNADRTSGWYTIAFPETMSTDAILLEVDSTHYMFNGQVNEEEELKTQVIAYRNSRDYSIGSELTRVVDMKFAAVIDNTQGLFNTTINFEASGITDTATVTARVRINREFDELFIPMQIVNNGKHVLTISYPVLEIMQNDRNQIDIYLSIDDGAITIDQGNILASLIASGISSASSFTGEIEVMDSAEDITISNVVVNSQSDSLTISRINPNTYSRSDTVADFTLSEIVVINGLTEVARVITVSVPLMRTLENGIDERVTEDGSYYRYTESEEV